MQLRRSFPLYPTPGQRIALAGAFGYARVVLSDAPTARQTGKSWISNVELSTRLIYRGPPPEGAVAGRGGYRMTAERLREWRGVKPVPGPFGAAITTRLRTSP